VPAIEIEIGIAIAIENSEKTIPIAISIPMKSTPHFMQYWQPNDACGFSATISTER
jgi:hypothetical protein